MTEKCDEALGALGHGDRFGGILLQNLGTDEVLAKTFQGGEVLADACRRKFLLDFQIPHEGLDVHFGKCFEWCIPIERGEVFFERFSVRNDRSFGIPALGLQVYQEILDVFV